MAWGQSFPVAALQAYADLRPALLRGGWRVVEQDVSRNPDGSWQHGYPEILCGNRICSANWKDRGGREMIIVLWWDNRGIYRVAPQQ